MGLFKIQVNKLKINKLWKLS